MMDVDGLLAAVAVWRAAFGAAVQANADIESWIAAPMPTEAGPLDAHAAEIEGMTAMAKEARRANTEAMHALAAAFDEWKAGA